MSIDTDTTAAAPLDTPALRPVVCVQGLGFVGTAMALAVADARTDDGPAYEVVGVELPGARGDRIAAQLNSGHLPIDSADAKMQAALDRAREAGNLTATTDAAAYAIADVAVVSVNLDLHQGEDGPTVELGGLKAAVRGLAERLHPGALIIVETTVPPGTCEHVLAPEVESVLAERGLAPDALLLAYSYERVMPGPDYFDSVRSYWRVYAGRTPAAADACEKFLSKVVDVSSYPLSRLQSTTAAELGKVLENSYRATTIAFMEEWGRFAEAIGVDVFEVIDAVRVRPTHSNMRQPGFGVGGYCLTKDPLFASVAARELFGKPLRFPFSEEAVRVNTAMPMVTLDAVDRLMGGIEGKRILLLGASYRGGVGDTRHSPSAAFARAATARGALLICHDPIASEWDFPELPVADLPPAGDFDVIVFAVAHEEYAALDLGVWFGDARPLVVDANRVLEAPRLSDLVRRGCRVWAIGRGEVEA